MNTRKIIVFTQPDSLPCEAVKLFLGDRGARFQERNVTRDDEAVRELQEKYNSRATPTLVIGDHVLIGFDPERIDQLLGR
ncbi:MAG TPA: glutaredoxin family protein [Candidatus Binatia bacterium]|nr:glutaredoxin family protein [Candidatus Binatia bacterium]